MIRYVLAVPLAFTPACQPSAGVAGDPGTGVGGPAPAPISWTVMDRFAPGGQILADFEGASSGGQLSLLLGLGGPGPGRCPSWLGGQCLDMRGPYRRLDVTTADASGVGRVDMQIPWLAPVGEYAMQLVEVAGTSSRLSPVVPTTLTNACTPDGAGDWIGNAPMISGPTAAVACLLDDDYFAVQVPGFTTLYLHIASDLSLDGEVTMLVVDVSEDIVSADAMWPDAQGEAVAILPNHSATPRTYYAWIQNFWDHGYDGVDYVLTPEYAPIP